MAEGYVLFINIMPSQFLDQNSILGNEYDEVDAYDSNDSYDGVIFISYIDTEGIEI
jgi:hypothetical protein